MIVSQRLAGLLTTILGLTSNAALADYGLYEATRACKQKTKIELALGNFDNIERHYGHVKLTHSLYEIYFNVNLRETGGSEPEHLRVKCRSEGFGKVREFSVVDGMWAFRSQREAGSEDRRISARKAAATTHR